MKKISRAQKTRFSVMGYLMFFLFVCIVATCSILAYSFIYEKSGGNKTVTAILTLAVLILIALACTVTDGLRRKFRVERPVQGIVTATEKITTGDFSYRLKPSHPYGKYDEFDVIMENINRMAEELSKTELLRTDFIANVSHEIKTPLAIIQNYAVGLCNNKLSEETRNEYIQTLLCASRRLSDLITNILKLNKMENQEIFPEKKLVDIGEQLRESVLAYDEKFEQKQLEIICDISDVSVVSDAGFLEIIWNNLLSNAVKFTDNGGKITVSLTERNGYAIASVSDTGCGISSEVGKHIFDKFFQGDTSRALEGNGLGLALVKRVIDILGGEITVESEIGKGTKFTIKIRKDQK